MARRDDGFALIEVLIALAVATLALSALYRAISTSLMAYRRSQEIEAVLPFAYAALDMARLRGMPADSSGSLPDGNVWRIRTEPVSTSARRTTWIIIEIGRDDRPPILQLRTLSP